MAKTRKKRPWRRAILASLATLVLADQVLLYTALSDGRLLDQPVAPYGRPLFSSFQTARFQELSKELENGGSAFGANSLFDPELGWCPKPGQVRGPIHYDQNRSRVGPEAWPMSPAKDLRTVALVGCSFTLGSEVRDEETWAYQLDESSPDLRLANFGVPGFGLDQALLRYSRDAAPLRPKEVWLGFFPGSCLRVLSHFPPLTSRWRARTVFFKPRFTIDEAQGLQLALNPAPTPARTLELLADPQAFLEALGPTDAWILRARPAYQPLRDHWSHFFSLGRVGWTIYDKLGRSAPDELSDRSSEVYRLNRALILELRRRVEAGGAEFRLLILPASWEVAQVQQDGEGYWGSLLEDLAASGVVTLDLTIPLLEAGIDQAPAHWMPEGHHSPSTNAHIARILADRWG